MTGAEPLVYGLGELPELVPAHRILAAGVGCARGASPKLHHVVVCACRKAFTGCGLTPNAAAGEALQRFYDHCLEEDR